MVSISVNTNTITVMFTSSGTWTCPECVNFINVRACGGGGGAGSGGVNGAGQAGGSGGGGGALETSALIKVIPGNVYTITIGAGGAGGASVTDPSGCDGLDGGDGTNTIMSDGVNDIFIALMATGGQHGWMAGNPAGGTGGIARKLVVVDPVGGNQTSDMTWHVLPGYGGTGFAQHGNLPYDGLPQAFLGGKAGATPNQIWGGGAGGGAGAFGLGGKGGDEPPAATDGNDGQDGAPNSGAGGGGGSGCDANQNSGKGGDGGSGFLIIQY